MDLGLRQRLRAGGKSDKSKRILSDFLLRLLKSKRAAVAVEFGLVGPLFIMLLCMVLEMGLLMFTQSVMDFATQKAARLIRLGAATSSAFQTELCNDVGAMAACSDLKYNVQSSSAGFSSFSSSVSLNASGNIVGGQYSPGTTGQAVIVQVVYNRSYLINWVGTILGTNNATMLVSTVAFDAEPY